MPTDHDLAQRAALGDVSARDELLSRHYRSIERLCRRLCPDATEADDVMQETLIAIIRKLGSYRGDASFTTWAYMVARTHHSRALRSDRRHRARSERLHQHLSAVPEPLVAAEEAIASVELRQQVHAALARLADLDRAVLECRDFQGYSAVETARALGLTVPAVKTRLHRARARLRASLTATSLLVA